MRSPPNTHTHTMANQMHPDRTRCVFIIDKEDKAILDDYAEKLGFTTSVLLREAAFRLAEEIQQKKRTILRRAPADNEGRRPDDGKPKRK